MKPRCLLMLIHRFGFVFLVDSVCMRVSVFRGYEIMILVCLIGRLVLIRFLLKAEKRS